MSLTWSIKYRVVSLSVTELKLRLSSSLSLPLSPEYSVWSLASFIVSWHVMCSCWHGWWRWRWRWRWTMTMTMTMDDGHFNLDDFVVASSICIIVIAMLFLDFGILYAPCIVVAVVVVEVSSLMIRECWWMLMLMHQVL